MHPVDNPLTTHTIHTSWEISIESYPNWRFGCNDALDTPLGDGSVPTETRTQSNGP